jgi:Arc/MetJ-type ribon-helix-helix transcriptional regulator
MRHCQTPILDSGIPRSYAGPMEVTLTPEQQDFIRHAIASGRLQREEDAIQEGLALWEDRERKRAEFLATLDEAKASLARGEGRVITEESMRELAEEVKQRGRARLAAEKQSST